MIKNEEFGTQETYLKISKMSFLLGMSLAAITEIVNLPDNKKHYKCVELMQKLTDGIDALYYGRPEND